MKRAELNASVDKSNICEGRFIVNYFVFCPLTHMEELSMEIRSLNNEQGASLVEYALLVALIAIASIVAIKSLGSKVSQQFSSIATQL